MSRAAAGALGPAARWLLTDRSGGRSAPPYDSLNLGAHVGDDPLTVAGNRAAVARMLGVPADRLVAMRPTHGRDVAVLDSAPGGDVPEVDALVTMVPGLALLAQSADCVPVVLADPVQGIVAAVHSGWRGVAVDVTGAALAAMLDLGADPTRVRAVLGPAICGACYDVPADRRDRVAAVAPEAAARTADGRPALDLRAGIAAGLRRAGVLVDVVGGCTVEDPRYFSYRRDGVTGRQGAAVVLTDPAAGARTAAEEDRS